MNLMLDAQPGRSHGLYDRHRNAETMLHNLQRHPRPALEIAVLPGFPTALPRQRLELLVRECAADRCRQAPE
jgi:hypothetical protein